MQLSARISLLNELKGELGYILTLILLTVVNATKTKSFWVPHRFRFQRGTQKSSAKEINKYMLLKMRDLGEIGERPIQWCRSILELQINGIKL